MRFIVLGHNSSGAVQLVGWSAGGCVAWLLHLVDDWPGIHSVRHREGRMCPLIIMRRRDRSLGVDGLVKGSNAQFNVCLGDLSQERGTSYSRLIVARPEGLGNFISIWMRGQMNGRSELPASGRSRLNYARFVVVLIVVVCRMHGKLHSEPYWGFLFDFNLLN